MANHAALIRQENLGRTVTRRGRRFIEFDMGGGVTRYVATIDPLHTRTSQAEIDTAFVADTGAWQWKLAQADFQVHARSVFNAGNLVEWRHESGEWIIVDPQSINWINQDLSRQQIAIKQAVTGVVNDFTLSFPAGYGAGRHFAYTAHPNRLIKHITIDSLANLPTPSVTGPSIWFEAEWSLSTSTGVDLWLDGAKWAKTNNVRVRTANRIEFRNTANTQVLWYADAPAATDANGEIVVCEYEVRRQGGASNLFITVRVPRAWLLTAAYPVMIDPTFTDQPDAASGVDVHLRSTAASNNFGVSTVYQTNVSVTWLLRWNISAIPAGATCDNATQSLWNDGTSTQNRSKDFYQVSDANADFPEGTKNNAAGVAGDCCWNYKEQTGGSETAWAGSAGLRTATTDYINTVIFTHNYTANDPAGTEMAATFNAAGKAAIEAYFGSTFSVCGFETGTLPASRTSDHGTAATRPQLVVDYTAAGGAVLNFAAALAAASATPDDAAVNVERSMSAALASASATPSASLAVLRSMAAALSAQSGTPDNATLSLIIFFSAALAGASATSDTAALTILRRMAAILGAQSATPDVPSLTVLRSMTAILAALSATPDDVNLDIAGLIQMAAVLAAQSATPDTASLAVLRAMAAALAAASATPDVARLAVLRSMSASLAATSATPDDAELLIVLIMASLLQAASATPDGVSLAVLRRLSAGLAAQSATPDTAGLAVLRSMVSVLQAASATPDDVILVTLILIIAYGIVTGPSYAGRSNGPDYAGDVRGPDYEGRLG